MSTQVTDQKTLPQFVTLERAVLYARVSGDDRGQDGRNLQGQVEMGRDYAESKGYQIVAELAEDDRGASGAEIDLPQLNRVREMARLGEFDVLVVRELDRLSRNLAKQLIVEEELQRAGVRVEYCLAEYEDTPEGRLNKHIRATVAEYEREVITERMARGRWQKVKSGSVMVSGRPPYGYRLVMRNNQHYLEIEPDEAKIIKLIFAWYVLDGLSIRAIAKQLTDMKVPTASDTGTRSPGGNKKRGYGQWAASTIRWILRNETYTGLWRFGKTSTKPSVTVKVPAIIDRERWQAAQERLRLNRQIARRNRKYDYLLSHFVTCGACKMKMTGAGVKKSYALYLYYCCPAVRPGVEYAHKCDAPFFRADHVDAVVWDWLESIFADKDPGKLEGRLRGYLAQQEQATNPLKDRLKVTDDLLERYNRELDIAVADLKALEGRKADRAKARILNDIERIESALDGLETQRATLVEQVEAQSLTEEQILTIKEFAAQIAADMETFRQDFESRRLLVEMLNLKAALVVEEGKKRIYVECVLGEDVMDCDQYNKALFLQNPAPV